jgi:amino acid adenylation domain-containing protein
MTKVAGANAAGSADAVLLGAGKRTPYERDATIHQIFRTQALRTPSAVAVCAEPGDLSYAELERRANQLANRLQKLGVGLGTTVGVALERSLDVPVVLLGILKAGGVYVPLDRSYPPERLEFIIEDASIAVIIGEGRFFERLPNTAAIRIRLEDLATEIAPESAQPPVVPGAGADSRAYVMYTSGSTGRPKGVEIVHRGVARLVCNTDYVDIAPDDIFLQFAPLSFDASTFEIWAPLLNGAQLAVPAPGPLSLSELGRALENQFVTTLWLTASLFRLMVETELRSLGGLRRLITGGDVVTAEHAIRFLEAFPGCRLIDGYGPTENTTFSCAYPIPSPQAVRGGVPIGRPIANSTAYVLDADLEPVAIGTSGELCVGGDGLARGYLNLPELTAERFVPDPFSREPGARIYRTGDLARLRPDGVIEFLGRIDHQYKIRGYRVELGEIESAIRSCSAVADCAVSVVTQDSENVLFAHVVPAAGKPLEPRDLRIYLNSKLPHHMIPTHISLVEQLPEHSSGKLNRQALAENSARVLREAAVAPSAPAPRSGSRAATPIRPFQGM